MLIKKKNIIINLIVRDLFFLIATLFFFLILAFSYNFFKKKVYTINLNVYIISGYDRPELFYIENKVFINIFAKQFSNPYFGNSDLKKNLLNKFDISNEQFDYITKNVSSSRIASTWNYTLTLKTENKSEKNFQLLQKYAYLINELSKIKIYQSYNNIQSSLFEVVIGNYDLRVNEQAESTLNNIPEKILLKEYPKLELYKKFLFINKSNFKNYNEMFSKEDEYLVIGIDNLDRYYLKPMYISDQFVYFLSILLSFLLFLFRLLILNKIYKRSKN